MNRKHYTIWAKTQKKVRHGVCFPVYPGRPLTPKTHFEKTSKPPNLFFHGEIYPMLKGSEMQKRNNGTILERGEGTCL